MSAAASRVSTARRLLRMRGLRWNYFSGDLFDEHGWNVLLILFVADAEERQITASQIVAESGASPEAGRRWIKYLQQADTIAPQADVEGGALELTPHARARMGDYLDNVAELFESRDEARQS